LVIRRFEVVNLIAMRKALDRHNATCPLSARAILLHPYDHGLLGWDNLWGLPVVADANIRVRHFRIDCEGYAEGAEEAFSDPGS
jgi:hypothetical protein